jgi:hypothetical protein
MALPSTTYDTATVLNPSGALTDFTLMVDLSRMSSAWWAAAENIDATNGRAAKDDGTELACDWIDYTHGSPVGSGWLRVKWSGTLATSGTQVLRIYPPVTGNGTVAAGDALGSNNAYDSAWAGYWPLSSDYNDRTANANNGSVNVGDGLLSAGDTSSPAGPVTMFRGPGADYISVAGVEAFEATTDKMTAFALARIDWPGTSAQSWEGILNRRDSYSIQFSGSGTNVYFRTDDGVYSNNLESGAAGHFDGAFHSYAITYEVAEKRVVLDGVQAGIAAGPHGMGAQSRTFQIGRPWIGGNMWEGPIGHVHVHNDARSNSWIEQEDDQLMGQAAFFGTWTNNPLSSGDNYNRTSSRKICRLRVVSRCR